MCAFNSISVPLKDLHGCVYWGNAGPQVFQNNWQEQVPWTNGMRRTCLIRWGSLTLKCAQRHSRGQWGTN